MTTLSDPRAAFDHAIAVGTLSDIPRTANYADNYMYMHSDSRGDHFKHIGTRQYLTAPWRDPDETYQP